MTYTISELLRQERPQIGNVLDTVRDYATAGWGINDLWLSDIIEKTSPSVIQLVEMKGYLDIGCENRKLREDFLGAKCYSAAVNYIDGKLAELVSESKRPVAIF